MTTSRPSALSQARFSNLFSKVRDSHCAQQPFSTSEPVSYTHLDVYKRQTQRNGFGHVKYVLQARAHKPEAGENDTVLYWTAFRENCHRHCWTIPSQVVADYFTKWVEAYAIPNQEDTTVAKQLVHNFCCRYGAPMELSLIHIQMCIRDRQQKSQWQT